MYGRTDDWIAEAKARQEAVELLLAVAEGKKDIGDVRAYLELEYPKLCFRTETETEKKW